MVKTALRFVGLYLLLCQQVHGEISVEELATRLEVVERRGIVFFYLKKYLQINAI